VLALRAQALGTCRPPQRSLLLPRLWPHRVQWLPSKPP
jgi:hypothetical protein